MYDDNNGRTIVCFLPIFWLKKLLEKINIFSNFWFQEMPLKREIFVNFLPQKFIDNIWHCFKISYSLCLRKFWHIFSDTGGIERFSAQETFRKILKVSHFYLAFSLDENYDEIEHSHSILSEFPDSYRDLSSFSESDSQNFDETL